LVGGLDLAPAGVEVAGLGVLLLLVDPPEVPDPCPSICRQPPPRDLWDPSELVYEAGPMDW
jgi:hypothetical protein